MQVCIKDVRNKNVDVILLPFERREAAFGGDSRR